MNEYHPFDSFWFIAKSCFKGRYVAESIILGTSASQTELKPLWKPFSRKDSVNLELAYRRLENRTPTANDDNANRPPSQKQDDESFILQTLQGRYDVNIKERMCQAVYWTELPRAVLRGTWFSKFSKRKWVPFSEHNARKLEEMYQSCMEKNKWDASFIIVDENNPSKIMTFYFCNANTMSYHITITGEHNTGFIDSAKVLYKQSMSVLKGAIPICRGVSQALPLLSIPPDMKPPEHVFFVVHGIGPRCDLYGRTIEECVKVMRKLADHLTERHCHRQPGRVEMIPINWCNVVHSDSTGIDEQLTRSTLPNIHFMRQFCNDSLADVLLYSSSKYGQLIIDTTASEICRLRNLFLSRNPQYTGQFSIAGHSLGSVICFDLMANQTAIVCKETCHIHPEVLTAESQKIQSPDTYKLTSQCSNLENIVIHELGMTCCHRTLELNRISLDQVPLLTDETWELMKIPPDHKSLLLKSAGVFSEESASYVVPARGIIFPQLGFQVAHLFAFGGPIAIFLATRGINNLSPHFSLPTCSRFFNLFHPYDPVAYRFETVVDPNFTLDPVLIQHHERPKYFHIAVKEKILSMRTKMELSFDGKLNGIQNINKFTSSDSGVSISGVTYERDETSIYRKSRITHKDSTSLNRFLQDGGRIDYVLQEGSFESVNGYVFSVYTHTIYWDSVDTLLFLLKHTFSLSHLLSAAIMEDTSQHSDVLSLSTTCNE